MAEELQPSVLTVPDKINDHDASVQMAYEFKQMLPGSLADMPLMRVLQHESRDPNVWKDMFRLESRMYKWIAFPRVLGADRIHLVHYCCNFRVLSTKLHAFGWIGSVQELRALAKVGVNTCDSSGPVWRGLNGYEIADTWPDIKFDPEVVYDDMNVRYNFQQADENLAEVLRACASL